MLCPACGARNRDGAPFCLTCRATIPAGAASTSPAPERAAPAGEPSWGVVAYYDRDTAPAPEVRFAGFWSRALALILDWIFSTLLAVLPSLAVTALLGWFAYAGQSQPLTSRESDRFDGNIALAAVVGGLITFLLVTFAYQLIMTARGGGWGMRIMRIRIIRADDGEDPGYGRALARVITRGVFGFVPIVGGLIQLLDHLWMIWDQDKQTWHDKAAGTYVVQR